MAGLFSVDGGRELEAGFLAFGAFFLAAPPRAQPQDPPAPPPTAPQTAPPLAQPIAPVSGVAAPRDWRGVFDAIDSGNWAAARAGIATLPPSVLTPVAKAEYYTAKGSPMVDA